MPLSMLATLLNGPVIASPDVSFSAKMQVFAYHWGLSRSIIRSCCHLSKSAVVVVLQAALSSLQSPAQATSTLVEFFSVLVSHL